MTENAMPTMPELCFIGREQPKYLNLMINVEWKRIKSKYMFSCGKKFATNAENTYLFFNLYVYIHMHVFVSYWCLVGEKRQ